MIQSNAHKWAWTGGAAVATAATLNAWLYLSPIDVSPRELPTRQDSQVLAQGAILPPIQGELTETLARPLFSPTRREFTPMAVAEVVVEQPQPVAAPESNQLVAPSFVLHGTRNIMSHPAALISVTEQMASEWYHVGQSVDGWTLDEIRSDGVSLSKSNTVHDLKLYPFSDGTNVPR